MKGKMQVLKRNLWFDYQNKIKSKFSFSGTSNWFVQRWTTTVDQQCRKTLNHFVFNSIMIEASRQVELRWYSDVIYRNVLSDICNAGHSSFLPLTFDDKNPRHVSQWFHGWDLFIVDKSFWLLIDMSI